MHNDHVNKNDPTRLIGIGLTLFIAIGVRIAFGFGIKTTKQAYNGGYLNSDLSTWNLRKIAYTPTCLADGTSEKRYYHLKTLFFLSSFCYNKGDSPVGISSVLFYFLRGN